MPPENSPAMTGAFGLVTDDGVEWTPLGKVIESELTSPYDYKIPSYVTDPPKLVQIPVVVSWAEIRWLRRLLGLPRLDYVWQYRRWNKGHGNGWTW